MPLRLSTYAAFTLAFGLAFTPASFAADEDYVSLFNGTDLSGWITPADKALFSVENGEIVGRTKGDLKKNEFLVVEKPYADFALKAKVKIRNGNSGIQFRSTRAADGAVSGPQADVADGYWGLLYEERGRGILERYPEKEANALIHKGDWNDFTVTAKGDHVVITINGTKVIDRGRRRVQEVGGDRLADPRRRTDGSPLQRPDDQAALSHLGQVERGRSGLHRPSWLAISVYGSEGGAIGSADPGREVNVANHFANPIVGSLHRLIMNARRVYRPMLCRY